MSQIWSLSQAELITIINQQHQLIVHLQQISAQEGNVRAHQQAMLAHQETVHAEAITKEKAKFSKEENEHADTKEELAKAEESVATLREFQCQPWGDAPENFDDAAPDYISKTAHYVQDLKNENAQLMMRASPNVQVMAIKRDRDMAENKLAALQKDYSVLQSKYMNLYAQHHHGNANVLPQQNFNAGSQSTHFWSPSQHQHFHIHHATPSAPAQTNPPTVTATSNSMLALTLGNGEYMDYDYDDGIVMPLYKKACASEGAYGACDIEGCEYLHQKQKDKFEAADIDALPRSRTSARRGRG
jgi:hypothetical protein